MSSRPSRRRFLKIAAVQTAALAMCGGMRLGAAPNLNPKRWSGVGLGGEVGIDLYGGDETTAVLNRCRAEMLRLEGIFSLYLDDSALSQLNLSLIHI